ncbi:hypothetical protein [Corallococcus sp. AB049A]|uniref:hypothetical protein n=1 Tax=Corallococcus sp. AB049A TaxID=2316721 RepID=UPI0011C46BCE|nr:hypothetical protein [Corallococcus sp. AB049A]
MSLGEPSKGERVKEFLRRLRMAPPVANEQEAIAQLSEVLNAVENELTSIPYDPSSWRTDGRMYPPQADNRRQVHEGLARYRNRKHSTFIGENGAIQIRDSDTGTILLSKPGTDGKEVSHP